MPYTVVGVLPRWFTYPDPRMQLWVPYASTFTPEIYGHHDFHQSYVVARLRPGTSAAAAVNSVSALQYQMHLANLNAPVAEDAVTRPMIDDVVHDIKTPLIVLLCAVGCMLLIACLNVSNLLVARGAARRKEVAVRLALGGSRRTLILEQMSESLLICLLGGGLGLLLSIFCHAMARPPLAGPATRQRNSCRRNRTRVHAGCIAPHRLHCRSVARHFIHRQRRLRRPAGLFTFRQRQHITRPAA